MVDCNADEAKRAGGPWRSVEARDDEVTAVREFAAAWGYPIDHVTDAAIRLRLRMSGLTLRDNRITPERVRRTLGEWIARMSAGTPPADGSPLP